MPRVRLPALLILLLATACFAPARPPNVVLIVLDDLGYDDLGSYGSPTIRTPNLDRLAAEGVRFTQYYASSPVCSPTRAALLTGLYPARFGFRQIVTQHSMRGIPADVPTLAEILRQAGYRTAHVGKWHLGARRPEFLPDRKGFDASVRKASAQDEDEGDRSLYTDYELIYDEARAQRVSGGRHLTEVLTDEAVRVLSPPEPFFLNLWYLAPHQPHIVPEDFDNSQTGYDLSSERGRYAALVTNADRQLGRVLERIDELGWASRTLVIVTSDNGSHSRGGDDELRGAKRTLMERGVRVPLLMRWPDVIRAGRVDDSVLASIDLLPTLAEIAGVDLPPGVVDGESFASVLAGEGPWTRSRPLYFEAKRSRHFFDEPEGRYESFAVRDGDWKLLFGLRQRAARESLFDLRRDPGEHQDLGAQHPETVARLRDSYTRWRREVGDLELEPAPSGAGVRREGDDLVFDGEGVATLGPHTLLDFHDGDFSFVTRVEPAAEEPAERQTIAARKGSWRLGLEAGRVALELHGERGGRLRLEAPVPSSARSHQVAFTVFAWKRGPATVRLYLDGRVAAEDSGSVRGIASSDAPITLGNADDGGSPFRGRIELPRISVLCLQPADLLADFERRGRGEGDG